MHNSDAARTDHRDRASLIFATDFLDLGPLDLSVAPEPIVLFEGVLRYHEDPGEREKPSDHSK